MSRARRPRGACCALFALALSGAPGVGGARPLAEWAPLDGLDADTARTYADHRRSRCLPDAAEVAFPVYPGAVVIELDWGRVRPACRTRDGWADLGGVVLATRDAPVQVTAWYADRLAEHVQYPAARGVLFIRARIAAFLWERDYYKFPNVAVRPAPPAWATAGYRTVIEFNQPAP
ncbi:MAG: hypothetical protein RLW62_07850 [Gammaproteobacteria bacterium]